MSNIFFLYLASIFISYVNRLLKTIKNKKIKNSFKLFYFNYIAWLNCRLIMLTKKVVSPLFSHYLNI